jgi:hypothetical protein
MISSWQILSYWCFELTLTKNPCKLCHYLASVVCHLCANFHIFNIYEISRPIRTRRVFGCSHLIIVSDRSVHLQIWLPVLKIEVSTFNIFFETIAIYVSPSNEGRPIVLVWLFLPLLLLLSEACPDHNFFVFPDRSIIFGMWVHTVIIFVGPWPLTSRSNNCFFN